MRFFARFFLLGALLIYSIVIGIQLVPPDGRVDTFETVLQKSRSAVTTLKQALFKDDQLLTIHAPGGVDVPLPITVNLVPVQDRFSEAPPQTNTPPPRRSSASTPPANSGPSLIDRIISFIPFIPDPTPPPVETPLSVDCSSTIYGSDIVWGAEGHGGTGGYTYSWAGTLYGNSTQYRVSYTTSGTKTIPLLVRDSNGTSASGNCARELTIEEQNLSPTTQALQVSCFSTANGNQITWHSNPSGGKTPYQFLWSQDASGRDQDVALTYPSTGGRTARITVTDADNISVNATCSGATTSTTPPSDTQAPSTPAGIVATAISSTQINLSWNASTDNVGVVGYRVYRGGTQIATVTNGTSYQDTGLSAGTIYSYTVRAYDAAGLLSSNSLSVSAITQSSTPPTQSCNLDWCAPYAVRPDQRYITTSPCVPRWTVDELSSYAKIVLMGSGGQETPNSIIPASSWSCFGPLTLANYAAYNDSIKNAATAKGRRVYSVHASRWDIASREVLAASGFNADWRVRPATPHQTLIDFFANDTSSDCGGIAGTCRFSYSYGGANGEGRDTGYRIRDLLDASGGPGTYMDAVYYVDQSNPGDRVAWADGVLMNQNNAAYRAFRINLERQILQEGHFDFIQLNHKFHFYKYTNNWITPPAAWLGQTHAANVTVLNTTGEAPFSNQPLNYTYSDYVRGWHATGQDLRAAGVPYGVALNGAPWVQITSVDDPGTSIDEAALVRETAEGAGLLELDFQPWMNSAQRAQFEQVAQNFEAQGKVVIRISSSCGESTSGTPTSCTTASADTEQFREFSQLAATGEGRPSLKPLLVAFHITVVLAILTFLFHKNYIKKDYE